MSGIRVLPEEDLKIEEDTAIRHQRNSGSFKRPKMHRRPSIIETINMEKQKTLRRRVRHFLDDPKSSRLASGFATSMTLIIVVSVVTFCLSTVEEYHDTSARAFELLEIVFNILFSIEFMVRVWAVLDPAHCHQGLKDVLKDIYLWFDILAVIPFWLEQIQILANGTNQSNSASYFEVVKALRMLRLMKLARQYDESIILIKAVRASWLALGVPFFFLAVALSLFASILYFCEKMEDPEGAVFSNIPHTMWFMAVTMTTVGYGDVSPNTIVGRIITSFAMIFGVLFLSMPLAIVGNNFCDIWAEKEKVIFLERLKEAFQLSGNRNDSSAIDEVHKIFDEIDTDGSGRIDFKEFRELLTKMQLKLSLADMRKVWATFDTDRSGCISVSEFSTLVLGEEILDDDEVTADSPFAGGFSHRNSYNTQEGSTHSSPAYSSEDPRASPETIHIDRPSTAELRAQMTALMSQMKILAAGFEHLDQDLKSREAHEAGSSHNLQLKPVTPDSSSNAPAGVSW